MAAEHKGTELSGFVKKVNEQRTAVLLDPPGEWYRISRYAEPSVANLTPGQTVIVLLDRDNFIRRVILTEGPAATNGPQNANLTPPAAERPFVSTERREGHILRQTALKCAVEWCNEQVEDYEPEDVCGIAETFLSWLADDSGSRAPRRSPNGQAE